MKLINSIVLCVISSTVIIGLDSLNLSIEPKLRNGVEELYIEANTRKSLTCRAVGKDQRVEWLDPEGNPVKRTSDRIFAQEHSLTGHRARSPAAVLTFAPADVHDTGVWTCRSGDVTETVPICVIERTVFVESSKEVIQEVGRAVTLSCQVRGHPEPRLYWVKNEQLISDDNLNLTKYKVIEKYNRYGLEGLLTIVSLEPDDEGTYTCIAVQESIALSNCVQEQSFNITLHVSYAPELEYNAVRNIYGKYNDSVILNCTAKAYPPPVYSWYMETDDNVYLEIDSEEYFEPNGTKAVLELIVNETTLEHTFQCRAGNIYGVTEGWFKVLRTMKPTKPQLSFYRSSLTNTTFKITWKDNLTFMIDDVDIQYIEKESLPKHIPMPTESDWNSTDHAENFSFTSTKEGHFITLMDLNENTEYWIRLLVSNEMGSSSWSNVFLFATQAPPEELFSSVPEDTAGKDKISSKFYAAFLGSVVFIVVAFTICVKKL